MNNRLRRSRVIVLGVLAICCIVILLVALYSRSESDSKDEKPGGTGEIDRNIIGFVPTMSPSPVMITTPTVSPTPSPTVFT